MIHVYNKALNRTIKVNRIIGKVKGVNTGPTIVIFAGIHGNETSGVFALKQVFGFINPSFVNGNIYGISGNLKALKEQKRFIDEDLNRLWTREQIESIKANNDLNVEENELVELFKILKSILKTGKPPFYFIDLHSTSSKTLPFITINDALINRKFSKQFPIPIVLGIEEYLNGPLLSYINELGYVSLGFESGQHDDINAVTNSIAFINLALVFSGSIYKEKIKNFSDYFNQLKEQSKGIQDILEVIYLHKIEYNDTFKMINGFKSFQAITKGTSLANSNNAIVKSNYSGYIFMPLYQNQGAEGFFIIKTIKPFYLKLSAILRHIKIDSLLVFLPGVSWFNKKKSALKVNLRTAKFLAKSLFHLLGYRSKQLTSKNLRFNNRERVAKTWMYKGELWY